MTIEKHITLLSIIQITLSTIGMLFGLALFLILSSIGVFIGEDEAAFILPLIGILLGGLIVISSAFGLIGGIGLLKRKQWSRIVLIIVSVLDLLNFPIGTAVAIYTFWVLMQDETIAILNRENQISV